MTVDLVQRHHRAFHKQGFGKNQLQTETRRIQITPHIFSWGET